MASLHRPGKSLVTELMLFARSDTGNTEALVTVLVVFFHVTHVKVIITSGQQGVMIITCDHLTDLQSTGRLQPQGLQHIVYSKIKSASEHPIIVSCAIAIVYMHMSKPYTHAVTEYIVHMKGWNASFWLRN